MQLKYFVIKYFKLILMRHVNNYFYQTLMNKRYNLF